jgi:hypothetical protein
MFQLYTAIIRYVCLAKIVSMYALFLCYMSILDVNF